MRKSTTPDAVRVRTMIQATLAQAEPARLLHRLDCVLLVAEGHSCGEVARWFDVDRRTVERWVRQADARGIEGLAERHQGGRPPALSDEAMRAVGMDLQASPQRLGYAEAQWSGKRLALHLQKCFGVAISVRTGQRMIAQARAGLPLSQ